MDGVRESELKFSRHRAVSRDVSDATRADPSYLELVARVNGVIAVGGASLSALWVVTLWRQWRLLSVVAGLSVVLIAFNAGLVSSFLLRRWGIERAEYFRNVVNLCVMLYADHMTHWPLVAGSRFGGTARAA